MILPLLKQVNLLVNAGEFVGIVGKSGAGKSTLLNMLTGVDHLTSGEVIVNTNGSPVSIHKMNEDAIANWRGHNLGVMFQSFQLLPMLTLVENVMLPMDLCGRFNAKLSRERALELLRLVEIEDHANKLPRRFLVVSSSVFRSHALWRMIPKSWLRMNLQAVFIHLRQNISSTCSNSLSPSRESHCHGHAR